MVVCAWALPFISETNVECMHSKEHHLTLRHAALVVTNDHFAGAKKEMMSLIRIDGETHRLLGACGAKQGGPPAGATGK